MRRHWWLELGSICLLAYFGLVRLARSRRNIIIARANGSIRVVEYDDQKPLLVLHIGPHKTATSTIQCELTRYSDALAKGNNSVFVHLGKSCNCKDKTFKRHSYTRVDTTAFAKCIMNNDYQRNPCHKQKEWKDFLRTLDKLARENLTTTISNEAFSIISSTNQTLQLLRSTLSEHFQVKVVIGYRRYYEWILSKYSQRYKRALSEPWPRDGGTRISPLATYFKSPFSSYTDAALAVKVHPTEYLRDLWSNNSFHVEIFNMHQEGNLVSNFVSQVLPEEAKRAIEIERINADWQHSPKNPSISYLFDYDMLAVQAQENGLIPNNENLSRQTVTDMIQQVLHRFPPSNTSFVCLTERELKLLLGRSLLYERHLFSKHYADETMAEHKAGFEDAVNRFKFCNLDIDELIQEKHVQKFFQKLRDEYGM